MKQPIAKFLLTILVFIVLSPVMAQPGRSGSNQDQDMTRIAASNPAEQAIAPLLYLASDQLKGRYIGRTEIDTAALYIATMFDRAGARTVPGNTGFYQIFYRQFTRPATSGVISIDHQVFSIGSTALQFNPADVQFNAPITNIGDDSAGALTNGASASLDVKGRLLLMTLGSGSRASAKADSRRVIAIRKALAGKGSLGLLVLLNADDDYWSVMQGRFKNEQLTEVEAAPGQSSAPNTAQAQLPVIVLRKPATLPDDFARPADTRASINIVGTENRKLTLRNVLAYVRGTDSVLNKQFIVLSSHYDHLGVTDNPQMEEGKLDSIYNGARDNAVGTAAVIDAARYFARNPPKRSVLFITYTAEEEGLIGSQYYAAHPIVPLDRTVYNLNIDNASYDDTTLISLVGLNRTSEDSLIIKACRAYSLSVNGDPTGGSLFYASDNTPLARAGVPAPTYSLGMRAMDSTIFNRYHRLSDEAANMDMHYVLKFIRAYILAAQYIADDPTRPTWKKGDEFERASQALYKN